MMGLPRDVLLTDEVVRIPFSVIIRPVDAAFHLQFKKMLRHGLVVPGDYLPMVDQFTAAQARSRSPG